MFNNPLRTGIALSATVGFAYAACSLFFWLWPDAGVMMANALFHGLDFGKLQSGPTLFQFGGFISALVVMMVWSFILGLIFGWLRGSVAR